jgi:putative transposase
VDRCETFSIDEDRLTYLRLVRENLRETGVQLLGWCLMTNHVHLVALPAREDSLSILLRRVHGRYAQYYNARSGRCGHLWQNRFFACALGASHLWAALAYVERNPVRAGIVERAADYPWSSAAAHLTGTDGYGVLDMEGWQREGPTDWKVHLNIEDPEQIATLRTCTYAGRPFGDKNFVTELGERFGRQWTRGRPRKEPAASGKKPGDRSEKEALPQFKLF